MIIITALPHAVMAEAPQNTMANKTVSDSLHSGTWYYTARLGLNIGGTAPVGMPATIRSMNSYKIQPNFTLGIDAEYQGAGE